MLENRTKRRLDEGKVVIGCFTKYVDAALAEFVALQGFDFLVFDGEHGSIEPPDVEHLTRAAEVRGVTPMARVPRNEAATILRFLDRGVHGVHVPWVNSAEEAERVVQAVKYHPRGVRGLAGGRASDWGVHEPIGAYTERSNRETLVVVHVETSRAVTGVSEFLEIDGVDVIFLGPTDLSHSLGHPGRLDHPEVQAAMEQVAEAVAGSAKVLGVFAAGPAMARRWVDRGARYITTGVEGLIATGARTYLHELQPDR